VQRLEPARADLLFGRALFDAGADALGHCLAGDLAERQGEPVGVAVVERFAPVALREPAQGVELRGSQVKRRERRPGAGWEIAAIRPGILQLRNRIAARTACGAARRS